MTEGFDRIRPPRPRPAAPAEPDAPDGGRAGLFSVGGERVPGPRIGLSLHCSRCQATTPLDAGVALRAAVPLFLLAPWRDHPVFALCPACDRRAWLRPGAARER